MAFGRSPTRGLQRGRQTVGGVAATVGQSDGQMVGDWTPAQLPSRGGLSLRPSSSWAQTKPGVGPCNADVTPSLRGGRVVGPGHRGFWPDSHGPPSMAVGRAMADLRV